MKLLHSSSSYSEKLVQVSFSNFIGEFWIKNSQYFIVLLGNCSPVSPKFGISLSDKIDDSLVVGRFEIDGQSYLIVKAEDTLKNTKPDLTIFLSGRELQIATLVAQGYSNKQMANLLHISKWTISTYLRRIFMKLGVDCRAALVYRCASLIRLFEDFNQPP